MIRDNRDGTAMSDEEWLIAHKDVGEKGLTRLLQVIQAYKVLKDFFVVIENLQEKVLPLCAAIVYQYACFEIEQEEIDNLRDTTEILYKCRMDILPESRKHLQHQHGQKLFHGVIGQAPLYSALGHSPKHEEEQRPFHQLLAQIFLANLHLLHTGKANQEKIRNIQKKASKNIRDICDIRELNKYSGFPEEVLAPGDYRTSLSSIKNPLLDPINDYLLEAANLRRIRKPSEGRPPSAGKKRKFTKEIVRPEDIVEGDITEIIPGVTTYASQYPDESTTETNLAAGGVNEDFQNDTDLIGRPTGQTLPENSRPLRHLLMQAHQLANQVAISNQNFYFSTSELSPFDVEVFLKETQDINADNETISILLTMFWTASTWEEALQTQVVISESITSSSVKSDTRFPALCWPLNTYPYWQIFSPAPAPMHENSENQTYNMSEIITYRLPEHAYKLLEPIVLSRRNLGAAQKMFPGESEGLEKKVRGFLKKINTRYLSELTLVRISCFLSNFVSRMPKSDMATARSMFGHSGYQGRTQHHYTCRASLDLKNLYQNATLAIQDNGAAPQLIQRDFQADDHQTQSDEYLGSCMRPTDDSIKNLTTQIKQDLVIQKELLKTNWCMETAAEHHNLFTVYSALVTLFGTAFRAITDPSLPEAHIDRDMSFALLNDKGMNDNYNTRKIYLAPIVLKQITHYQKHISKLYDLSAGSHTEFIPWYRTHKSTGKVSSLFLFEVGSYKMTPLGPSTLMDFLSTKYNWHLPANSGRHVVRSLLLERNCPPGIIDAFLGHITRGTEPWSVQSGLSPTYFREELAKHLIPILFEMGWTDISGLGGPAHE